MSNALINAALDVLRLKNDAALSRKMELAPPVISKLRHNRLRVGPAFILRLHELAPEQLPVARIRELMAQQ